MYHTDKPLGSGCRDEDVGWRIEWPKLTPLHMPQVRFVLVWQDMSEDVSLSRNKERFVQFLLLGESIVDAAKHTGISERTAFRWLDDPDIQRERKQREAALAKEEQAEITRILTSGYALMHKRVEALNKLSEKLEAYLDDENKVWLPDVKAVGFERIDLKTFNADLFKEYRATFDDLAKELGHRIKRQQELGEGSLVELLNAEHASLLADLEALPDGVTDQKHTEAGDTRADSVSPGA